MALNRPNLYTFVILVALALVVGLPASAHTQAEQAVWHTQWEDRAMHTGYSEELLAELSDFIRRHTPPVSTGSAGHPVPPGPVEHSSGVEQWRTLVSSYFPADQVEKALRVMACESGGDPYADNPRSTAAGLYQFLASTWAATPYAASSVYDPTSNVAAAAWLWSRQGWTPWVCQ